MCLAKGQDSSPELQRCPEGPAKARSCPAPPLPAPQLRDSSLAAPMGDQAPDTGSCWPRPGPSAGGPRSPPPTAPRCRGLAQLPGRQACSAGREQRWGVREGWASAEPYWGNYAEVLGLSPARLGAQPSQLCGPLRALTPSLPAGLVPQSCWHLLPVPAPCGSPVPCPGDAGRAPGLTPSPACLLTHSLWLPGQICAQVGGAWQSGSFSLFCPLSGASRLQPRGRPFPGSPFPALAHRAWTG